MQYFIKNSFLYFFLVFIVSNLNAQNYPSVNINTKDGLPNNQVESIFKDSRGILWVGTNNGLSKIENNKISNFFIEDGIAHNSAWDIIEDKSNIIWIASYGGGITKYDGKKFKVINEQNGLANNYVRKLFEYKNYVLVGTKNGLSFINSKNDSITTFDTSTILNKDSGLSDFQVMAFFVYNNEVYCGTFRNGIYKLDIEQVSLKKIADDNPKFLFSTYLKDNLFYFSIDDRLASEKGSIFKYNIEDFLKNKGANFRFGKSIIWEYVSDSNNNIYGAGWDVHLPDGGVFQINDDVFIDKSENFGVTSANIKCLFYDEEFNFLYAGSQDKGYYKIDLNKNITYFKNEELSIIDIENEDSNLAILTKNSFTLLKNDTIAKKITSQKFLDIAEGFFKRNPTSQVNEIIYTSKLEDKDEVFFYDLVKDKYSYWISTYIGLFEFDFEGNFLNYYAVRTNKFNFDFQGRFINPIPYTDLNIVTNLASSKGFNDNFQSIIYPLNARNTPVNVSAFIKSKNELFISTLYKGLFLYKKDTIISLNETNNFKELELTHLAINNESKTLAIASNSGEVYLADIKDNFNILNKISRELIVGNTISFLEIYKDYTLIGTEKGLSIYNNGNIQFINEEQGLKNANFNSSKLIGTKLIIGTNSGYYKLDLESIINGESPVFNLKIDEFIINHGDLNKEEYTWFNLNKNRLKLNYDENHIDIYYGASNHPYPNKLLYSYQIGGVDTSWSEFSKMSNILIPYLPSGKFDIKVKVKDLNTAGITTFSLLTLIITPSFWKTWWFILIIIVLIVGTSLLIYNKRVEFIKKREEQKAEIQKRIVESKLAALQSQMNPHFVFNAMNSIQNYMIDNDINNALMYFGEFAKLMRKTFDNSLQPYITLSDEISYLKSYISLENMRYNNKVEVTINYNNIDVQEIYIPPMLIQPFVENVFVHAFKIEHSDPSLIIKFIVENNVLTCSIEDNGIGMCKKVSGQMQQSKGLKLVSERLQLLNESALNSLKIESKTGNGTRITLQLQQTNSNIH